MTEPDWERYRAARNAPAGSEPKRVPSASGRGRRRDRHPVGGLEDVFDAWFLLAPLIAASGFGAIWAQGLGLKILLGAIAVGITVLWYIARDATDEPRTTGEWAPPKDARAKRRR